MTFGQRQLGGPRLPPVKGAATHLVVLCHGYGADGNDLIGLAPHWQSLLPTVAFAAPNAPERCPGAGYQWFPISRLDPEEIRHGVETAAMALNSFLDAELARLGLSSDRLMLVGFSQGTMLSLHIGFRREPRPAAIVGYSGMLAAPEALPNLRSAAPPVLLVHGEADTMIPVQALFAAAIALGRAGVPVQWHVSSGIPHSIDPDGLRLGGTFLSMALRGTLRPKATDVSCPVA